MSFCQLCGHKTSRAAVCDDCADERLLERSDLVDVQAPLPFGGVRGWVAPSIVKKDGQNVIYSPPELAGREVVCVDASPCARYTPGGLCALVVDHAGDHWNCSRELVRSMPGALALRVVES